MQHAFLRPHHGHEHCQIQISRAHAVHKSASLSASSHARNATSFVTKHIPRVVRYIEASSGQRWRKEHILTSPLILQQWWLHLTRTFFFLRHEHRFMNIGSFAVPCRDYLTAAENIEPVQLARLAVQWCPQVHGCPRGTHERSGTHSGHHTHRQ